MVRICALLLTACVAGAMGTQGLPTPPPAYDGPGPVLTVWVMRGSGPGGIDGLRVAAWSDGHVLLGPAHSGRADLVLVVNADPALIDRAVRAVQQTGVMQMKQREVVVPSSGFCSITVSLGGVSTHAAWHGALTPGFGGDLNTDAAYRSFICSFQAARSAIENICPQSVRRPSDPADLRGYNVKEPWNTGWRREQMKAGRR